MAKKVVKETLSKGLIQRLNAINISAKTEDEAREKLLAILEKEDIDGMEDESIDTLIDIAESFVDSNNANDEEEGDDECDDEGDEEEDETNDDESDSDEEEDENDDDPEDEEEEEEEPEVEQPKKPAKKVVAKKEKVVEKKEKVVAKKEKKAAAPTKKRGVKLDPQNNPDDQKEFDVLKKVFPESKFQYRWVANSGCSIVYKGVNSSKNIAKVENCSRMEDGNVKCIIYFQSLKNGDALDNIGVTDYEICWSGCPFLKNVMLSDAVEILKKLLDDLLQKLQKNDHRLGENRKKMEESLKKTSKVDEVEEEDEVEEKPVKKVVAKKSAKGKK